MNDPQPLEDAPPEPGAVMGSPLPEVGNAEIAEPAAANDPADPSEPAASHEAAAGDPARTGALEALLFASPRPIPAKVLARRLNLSDAQTAELLRSYAAELQAPARGLQLRETPGGWKLETKPAHEAIIQAIRTERGERPLSQQALESLAVIALRQPVSTEQVSSIRGLDSSATIDTLLRRKLIARADEAQPGKAATWRTTQNFLDFFGLASLAEMYADNRAEQIFGLGNG